MIFSLFYIVLGLLVATFGVLKINELSRCHSLWYRYAYILTTIGGGCMPFRFYYPSPFADWPVLLVVIGAAMIVSQDKRRPLKGNRNDATSF